MASRHARNAAAPRPSGKPSPPPKWRAVLDRMVADPPDAGSRQPETRPVRSALSAKAVGGPPPGRTRLGRAGRDVFPTAGHDPTIETALELLRARERDKSAARSARRARRALRAREQAEADGVAEVRSCAKRDGDDTAEARERTRRERADAKKKRRRLDETNRRERDVRDERQEPSGPASPPRARSREPLPLGGVDHRAKLESAIERARRVEAESTASAAFADPDRKPHVAAASARNAFGEFRWRPSCADLVGLLDDAYGSFLTARKEATIDAR